LPYNDLTVESKKWSKHALRNKGSYGIAKVGNGEFVCVLNTSNKVNYSGWAIGEEEIKRGRGSQQTSSPGIKVVDGFVAGI
jgi:hypothetical protein